MYLEQSGGVVGKTWWLFMFLYEGECGVVVSEKQYVGGGGLDGSLRLPVFTDVGELLKGQLIRCELSVF